MLKNKKIIIIILIIEIVTICSFAKADDEDEEEFLNDEIVNQTIETVSDTTDEPILNARSAVIYDRTTKQMIWGKNENDRRAMASTTKIMTAIVVIENSNLQDIVTISKKAANTGGSRLKIKEKDKISVNDLLYGLMLRSGNDAAVALAEYVGGSIDGFANMMNKKAEELQLKNTHFVTPHGLDDDNHYTTAFELAIISDYALNNEIFRKIVKTKSSSISINGVNRNIYNTNELLGNMYGVDGIKTGFTNKAGRCLVTSCTRGENQIITVALGCDAKKQRTSDSVRLIEYAFKNYTRVNIEDMVKKEFEKWKQINQKRIYINKAQNNKIEFKIEDIHIKTLPIKISEKKNIVIEINAIYNYEAPMREDTKIGNIIVKNKDKIIESIDILCAKEIERKNIFSYLKEIIDSYNLNIIL